MERHIDINRYDYDLPEERIAKFPLAERSASKLLVYRHGEISERHFADIGEELPAGQLLVFNNTKVIRARIIMHKPSGARVEVFCLEPCEPADYERAFAVKGSCEWSCIVGNLKKWKEGYVEINFDHEGRAEYLRAWRVGEGGREQRVRFEWSADMTFGQLLETLGRIPIPPYLNRETQESDKTTYQTVYSKIKGSVAAPTAGLHFTERVLADLDAHGIDREEVTLHVGAGTFKPVKSEEIAGHEMHTEYICVHRSTIEKLLAHGGACIAVGTTSVRTLESLYYIGVALDGNPDASEEELHVPQWMPYEYAARTRPSGSPDDGRPETLTTMQALQNVWDYLNRHELTALHTSTQIIIAPGYEYHIVRMMVTNFHQPQSTLLLLVSAFVHGDWRTIYDYALAHDFRFLSYGDSSLLIP